ncbi:hypothetical protein [Tateyamaria sp. syn59]|uniref:hypothetical protein n=1 Tax=Tateyamaria sp. syn59 TaxID=2576942 RepID=UPI0011BF9609|nr:hypothetical protein [Tateyamaria sp. syn59]
MTNHSRRICAVPIPIWTCVSIFPPVAAHDGSHRPGMMALVEWANVPGHKPAREVTMVWLGLPDFEFTAILWVLVRVRWPQSSRFAQNAGLAVAAAVDDTQPGLFTLAADVRAVAPEQVFQ